MTRYRGYWLTWLVLLALTLVMIAIGSTSLPKTLIVLLLVAAMFTKAVLISGNFMHLRLERLILTLTVAIGILFTAGALFLGIAPDGARILHLSQ